MRKLVFLLVLGVLLAATSAAAEESVTSDASDVVVETVLDSAQPPVGEKPANQAVLSISGSVVDIEGKPIAGARVYVMREASGERLAVVYADKRGRFTYKPRIGQTDPALFFVAVAKGCGYGSESWEPGRKKPLRITLLPGLDLKGSVVDEAKKPLSGVSVSLNEAYGFIAGDFFEVHGTDTIATTLTRRDGSFVLQHLPDPTGYGEGYVQLRLRGKGTDIRTRVRLRDPAGQPQFLLPVEGSLQGKFLLPDKSGPPPERFYLTVKIKGDWGEDWRNTETDADGAFRLDDMPPGEISMIIEDASSAGKQAAPSPYALPAQKLSLKSGEQKSIELTLQKAALVKGTVVDAATGKPISGAQLHVRHSGHVENYNARKVQSDKKGEFTFGAPAGRVDVTVTRIIGEDGEQLDFGYGDDAPRASFTVAEGEQKTGVVVKVDTSDAQDQYGSPGKKTPPDFEIVPGTYQLVWEPSLSTGRIYSTDRAKSPAEAKALMKKLPPNLSDKARFSAMRLDGKGNLGLIGIIEDGDKLYIDANRNWDLSDDVPIKLEYPPDDYMTRQLESVTVQSRQGPINGRHTNNPITLRPTAYRTPRGSSIRFDKKGGWKGTLDTNKGKVDFALADFNPNGIYTDLTSFGRDGTPDSPGDVVLIDSAGLGRIPGINTDARIFLQPAVKVARKYYVFKPSDVGDSLAVEPYTGPMAKLEVKVGAIQGLGGEVTGCPDILSPNGLYEFGSENMPIELPAGNCGVHACPIVLHSKSGKDLRLAFSTCRMIDLEADRLTILEVSGDLSVAIDPDKKDLVWSPGSVNSLDWAIKIGDGFELEAISDENRALAPIVKLFDSAGKMAAKTKAGFT